MDQLWVGTQFKASEAADVPDHDPQQPGLPVQGELALLHHLKQLTNVSFNPTVVPFADYNAKVGTLIAAGQEPYIIPKIYPGGEDAYVAGGQILPVSDYVQHMPNFQAKVAAWNLDGDLDTLRQSDGKYYLLPGLHQNVVSDYTMGVRTDLLSKYNIATPSTLAQVEAMLTTFKDKNPGHYPFSDRYNQPTAGGAFLEMIGNAYGTNAGWNYQTYNQGAYFDHEHQEVRVRRRDAAVPADGHAAQRLVQQGPDRPGELHPARHPGAGEAHLGQVVRAHGERAAGRDRPEGDAAGQTRRQDPGAARPGGRDRGRQPPRQGLLISAKAANDPNFIAMLQFIDWLWYSDAGMLYARWGIEGTTYTGSVADGTFQLEPTVDWAGLHPNAKIEINVQYGFYNGVFSVGGATQLMQTQYPPAELAFQKIMDARTPLPVNPPAPLTTLQSQTATTTGTSLMDYVQSQTIGFITGKRPLSQWSAFQSELQGKGSANFLNIFTTAYNTYKSAHPGT